MGWEYFALIFIGSIIAGTINPQHLRENVEKARRACE